MLVHRGGLSIVVLLILSGQLAGIRTAEAQTTYKLRPIMADDGSATDDLFSGWRQEAQSILENGTSSEYDFPCTSVGIQQSKPLSRDGKIANVVDTAAKRQKLKTVTSGNVVVVDALNWCGGFSPSSFAGCEGAGPIILVNLDNGYHNPGWTLIHEIGHRVGLSHTAINCPVPLPPGSSVSLEKYLNVMYCRAHEERKSVSQAQCDRFRDSSMADLPANQEFGDPLVGVAAQETVPEGAGSSPPVDDVRFFLRSRFGNGTPYDEIDRLTSEDMTGIRSLLSDVAQRPLWANAVVVLGLRGEAGDVQRLIDLFERTKGSARAVDVRTQTSVAYSLGILAARLSGEPRGRALAFLIDGFRLETASAYLGDRSPVTLAQSFARGISLSGDAIATKGVLDTVAAAGNINTSDSPSPGLSDYVEGLGIRHAPAPVRVARVPPLEADEVQELAVTAVQVSREGILAHLRAQARRTTERSATLPPTIRSNPLASLNDLALGAEAAPETSEALKRLGLETIPSWQAEPLKGKIR